MREAGDWPPVGVGGTPLFVDMSVALAVYKEPPFDALDVDTLLPRAEADLTFGQSTTGFGPLELGVHRVGHMTELAL